VQKKLAEKTHVMSKQIFLKLEKHDFPDFLLQGFTKIAKVHHKKNTKILDKI